MHNTRFSLPLITLSFLFVLSACTSEASDIVRSTSIASPVSTTSTPLTSVPTVTPDVSQDIQKNITYSTDRGKERVSATFSITTDSAGEIITVSASAVSADRESRQYIARFNSAAQKQVVGRKISELSLSALGGASDTTDAFMQVVSTL